MPVPNPPIIGYDNVLRHAGAVITASDVNHPYAYDWRLDRAWVPSSAGSHFIEVQLPTARTVNYAALFAHDIGVVNGQVTLSYFDGTAFIPLSTPIVPVGNECLFELLTSVSSDRFRLDIDAPAPFTLGAVAFGERLALDSGFASGFIPPNFSVQADILNSISEKGLLIGRSLRKRAGQVTLNPQNLDELWMRSHWLPFRAHALQFPFFLQWNDNEFPNEAAFCWSTNAPEANGYASPGFMNGSLSVQCLTELAV